LGREAVNELPEGPPAGAGRDGFDIDQVLAPVTERPLRQLPHLVAGAVRLTWEAARNLLVVSTGLQLVTSVALAVQVLVGKRLVSALLATRHGRGFGPVIPDLVVLVVATAVLGFASLARFELSTPLAERVARHATGKVLDVAVAIDLLAFETPAFHDRLQRATVNAQARPAQMTSGLLAMLGSVAGVVGIGGALLVIQPLFFALVVVAYIPVWLATLRASRVLYRWSVAQTQRERRRDYLQFLLTRKDEAKEVRAYGVGAVLRGRYEELYDARIADLTTTVRRRLRLGLLGALATSALTGAALGLLVWMVSARHLNLAGAAAAAAAIVLLGSQLQSFASGVGQLYESSLFIEDFNSFVASTPRFLASGPAPPEDHSRAAPPARFEVLRAEDVSFTYPSRTATSLSGVTVEVRAGEVVALVGENGSGKTTLAKILAGLYRPQTGRVTWDGVDLRGFDPTAYRERLAVLFQDFIQYQLTVHDNIGLGRWQRHDRLDLIEEAARRAGAASLVDDLPGGYAALLGPEFAGGVDLSGGQWQRLALARAFFRDTPFIILDEPTAALDPRSEAELFDHVRSLFRGRSVLLISHRFSSVRNADRIYVLRRGRVIEEGTHEALMAREGEYAELFRLQAASFFPTESLG
jgi:ATP-binding cassette subfamily B protein